MDFLPSSTKTTMEPPHPPPGFAFKTSSAIYSAPPNSPASSAEHQSDDGMALQRPEMEEGEEEELPSYEELMEMYLEEKRARGIADRCGEELQEELDELREEVEELREGAEDLEELERRREVVVREEEGSG